jgi:hypothetical protein
MTVALGTVNAADDKVLDELDPAHPDYASAVAAMAERKDVRRATLDKALLAIHQLEARLSQKH